VKQQGACERPQFLHIVCNWQQCKAHVLPSLPVA
jgi:hypothetical protein